MPGVRKVAAVPSGVAVVADSFGKRNWRATRSALIGMKARACFSTSQMMQQFREQAKSPGKSVRRDGDPDAALAKACAKDRAVYEVPYLSHLMMEPLNCAWICEQIPVRSGLERSFRRWTVPPQQRSPAFRRKSPNPYHLPGGGFGRRATRSRTS